MQLIVGRSDEGKIVLMVTEFKDDNAMIPLHRISMTTTQWNKVKKAIDSQQKQVVIDTDHQQMR